MITWEQFGKDWVALDGDNVVGIVTRLDKESGLPCEAYTFQSLQNVYLTADAAKGRLEQLRIEAPEGPKSGLVLDLQQIMGPFTDAMKSASAAPRSLLLGIPCSYCSRNGAQPPSSADHSDPSCVFLMPGVYERAILPPSGAGGLAASGPAAVEAPAPLPEQ